jgi:hypothetical protein
MDYAYVIIGNSDGYMYCMGTGNSVELTSGDEDVFLFRLS